MDDIENFYYIPSKKIGFYLKFKNNFSKKIEFIAMDDSYKTVIQGFIKNNNREIFFFPAKMTDYNYNILITLFEIKANIASICCKKYNVRWISEWFYMHDNKKLLDIWDSYIYNKLLRIKPKTIHYNLNYYRYIIEKGIQLYTN